MVSNEDYCLWLRDFDNKTNLKFEKKKHGKQSLPELKQAPGLDAKRDQ